jgi:soluble lytic murein transglycosylase
MRLLAGVITIVLVTAATPARAQPAPPEVLVDAVDAMRRGRCVDVAATLSRLAQAPPPTGPRAAFLLGRCLVSLGRYTEARGVFLDAAQRHETLSAYARLGAARAALMDGDVPAAAELARPSPDASPAVAARLRLVGAGALIGGNRPRDAARRARAVALADHPDGILADAWWLLGQASEAAGDISEARAAYAMVWWGLPDNPHTVEAARRLRALAGGRPPVPTPHARAVRGLRLVEEWDSQGAERELAQAVKGPLPVRIGGPAWYQLGLLRLGTRPAVGALQQATLFPADRDRTLFWLGLAWLRIGRSAEAASTWMRLRREYPDSLWSARAIATVGRAAEAAGQWAEADRLYVILIDRYPRSPRVDDARWRRAWMRYRNGQAAEARVLFLRYGVTWPEAPRAAAHLTWAWRTSAGAERSSLTLLREVAERYPLTFYGRRARTRLGLPPLPPPQPAGPAALADDRFRPAHEELAALGLEAEALEEVEARMTDDAPDALRRAASELYARSGDTSASITALDPLIDGALYRGRHLDGAAWRLAYPRAYWPVVAREATRHGLDPLLILALIREESRFDPRAVSSANAVGLMQLLPSTAREVLGRPIEPGALTDPDLNIRAGTAYLAGLLRGFGGTVPLAVGGYNAGPGGVRRHAALARSDLERFVEELPYAETRAYVQRVLQSYGIYQWLYR